jgi:hypothetical protein
MIGDMEVQKGLHQFQMTYESGVNGTEILEIPLTVYQESLASADSLIQTYVYRNIEEINNEKEQRRVSRMSRAYDAIKSMMGTENKALKCKEELRRALPILVDTPTTEYNRDRFSVIRKKSFNVTLNESNNQESECFTGDVQANTSGKLFSKFGSMKGSLKFTSANNSSPSSRSVSSPIPVKVNPSPPKNSYRSSSSKIASPRLAATSKL